MDPTDDDIDGLTADINAALDGTLGGGEGDSESAEQKEAREYARDEAGRFAAKQAEAAAAQEAQQPAQTQQAWKPVWYKDEFGDWQKGYPEPFRKALEERERAFAMRLQEVGQPANNWRELEQSVFTPEIVQNLRMNGQTPQGYVQQLHQINTSLAQDPVNTLAWIAQQVGVDLSAFAEGQGEEDAYVDPNVAALQAKIYELEQRLGGVSEFQQSTIEQQRAQREAEIQSSIQAFAQGKPHFDALKPIMSRLLAAGEATGLGDAYEKAGWLHPEVRQSILEEQRKASTTRARTAAVSPRSAPLQNGRAATSPHASIEDTVRSLIDGGTV